MAVRVLRSVRWTARSTFRPESPISSSLSNTACGNAGRDDQRQFLGIDAHHLGQGLEKMRDVSVRAPDLFLDLMLLLRIEAFPFHQAVHEKPVTPVRRNAARGCMRLADEPHLLQGGHFTAYGRRTAIELAVAHELIGTDRRGRSDITLDHPAQEIFLSDRQMGHGRPYQVVLHRINVNIF
ncbi:MAG: hypothetical protein MZV64_02665 [Ignavibacteriales bacterium]|nr:hypothetical protein [Ignavibacteriales bacterium]